MNGRRLFQKLGVVINVLSGVIAVLPYRFRLYLFRSFCGIGGSVGILIRYLLFCKLVKKCGTNVIIKKHVYLYDIHDMICGSNVSIHEMCYLNGLGGLTIGNDVSIAHGTSILTTNHLWEDDQTPIKYNKVESAPVVINNDVWIGCGARIMAGVTIGQRSIVAAGAVVTRDVETKTLVGGCPARLIRRPNAC